jgi:hypothetical protein
MIPSVEENDKERGQIPFSLLFAPYNIVPKQSTLIIQ